MSSTPYITITGHQLQQALAYVAPDLTPQQLQDSVRIDLVHQPTGNAVAAAVTLPGGQLPSIALDDHIQWPEQHPDDRVVDGWASAMKDRMAKRCGRNRRDIAGQGRLPDGWASGVFSSCGWQRENWTAQQISAGLIEHLYRQDLLEVAIHALILREREMPFDRRQMRQVVPPQALEVAAEMRMQAQCQRDASAGPVTDKQLDQWADHIESARDTPSIITHLLAAPVMYEALQADQQALEAERVHTALVQQARHEGWYADQQNPGHEAIRHAAQMRWEQELRAFDLKRRAVELAKPAIHQPGSGTTVPPCIDASAGARYHSMSVDIKATEPSMAEAA